MEESIKKLITYIIIMSMRWIRYLIINMTFQKILKSLSIENKWCKYVRNLEKKYSNEDICL